MQESPTPTGVSSLQDKKHAVVVGINISSSPSPRLQALKDAESDAQEIARLLSQDESGFELAHPTLIGPEASALNVRRAVSKLIKDKPEGDLLLFYFIGPSDLVRVDDDDEEAYLVTPDFDRDLAKDDPDAYLSLSWLRQMLFERNRTADVVIILDCNHASYISRLPMPAEQILQALQGFANSVQEKERSRKRLERSWAILTSSGANVLGHRDINRSGQGYVHMTSLILAALSGKNRKALMNGNSGDLTLQSLHGYLEDEMKQAGLPYPALIADFRRRWVIIHLPPLEITLPPKGSNPTFFDERICQNATFDDLDAERVEAFFERDRVVRDCPPGPNRLFQMEEMGLVRRGHPSYGALLCFGKHPTTYITGANTHCTHWQGIDSSSNLLDDRVCQGGLFQQFAAACEFLTASLSEYNLSFEERPVDPNQLPFRALEEALLNALIHQEYVSEPNREPWAKEVEVEVFSNRVQISSYGAPPYSLDLLKEILENGDRNEDLGSHPKNPQILEIFYLFGRVERVGSGINRIQLLMEDANLRVTARLTSARMLVITLYLPRVIRQNHLKM